MNILVITDNEYIYQNFKKIIEYDKYLYDDFQFMYSWNNRYFLQKYQDKNFKPINLKISSKDIVNIYDLVISLHCKQIFPSELVNGVRCINVLPGLNPYNRGWYPQVFSILNKLPAGVTIHEIDEKLDHGLIIIQNEIKIEDWETSYDVYKNIQIQEIILLEDSLKRIIDNNYNAFKPNIEGNINLKKDFNELLEVDLEKSATYREVIDFLRAMTYDGYKNAYFYDKNGIKVFVEIKFDIEEN